jgi:hypothetical protein
MNAARYHYPSLARSANGTGPGPNLRKSIKHKVISKAENLVEILRIWWWQSRKVIQHSHRLAEKNMSAGEEGTFAGDVRAMGQDGTPWSPCQEKTPQEHARVTERFVKPETFGRAMRRLEKEGKLNFSRISDRHLYSEAALEDMLYDDLSKNEDLVGGSVNLPRDPRTCFKMWFRLFEAVRETQLQSKYTLPNATNYAMAA